MRINKLFDEVQGEFYKESKLMVNECWGGDMGSRMRGAYKWGKIIDKELR